MKIWLQVVSDAMMYTSTSVATPAKCANARYMQVLMHAVAYAVQTQVQLNPLHTCSQCLPLSGYTGIEPLSAYNKLQ